MKIAIIGCGWLGLPLGKNLVSKGHSVYGSTRNKANLKVLESAKLIPFLISSYGDIQEDHMLDAQVLIITVPPFNRDEPSQYVNFLSKVIQQFKSLKQVVYTSSTGIYPNKNGTYKEDFIFLEREKSSILYQAEMSVLESNSNSVILRLGGLFGPSRHPAFSLAGKSDLSNPFGRINFIHLDDVIEAISHVISENASGIYNLVFPEHPFRKEYYTWLYRHYNLDSISFDSNSSTERIILSNKIEKELHFTPKKSPTDLDEIFN